MKRRSKQYLKEPVVRYLKKYSSQEWKVGLSGLEAGNMVGAIETICEALEILLTEDDDD